MAMGGREEEKQENGTSYLLSRSLTAEGEVGVAVVQRVFGGRDQSGPPLHPHLSEPHPDPRPFSGPGEVEEVEGGRGGGGGTGEARRGVSGVRTVGGTGLSAGFSLRCG